jgi:hypothetical protein
VRALRQGSADQHLLWLQVANLRRVVEEAVDDVYSQSRPCNADDTMRSLMLLLLCMHQDGFSSPGSTLVEALLQSCDLVDQSYVLLVLSIPDMLVRNPHDGSAACE